jgi:hypothetical protein
LSQGAVSLTGSQYEQNRSKNKYTHLPVLVYFSFSPIHHVWVLFHHHNPYFQLTNVAMKIPNSIAKLPSNEQLYNRTHTTQNGGNVMVANVLLQNAVEME